MYYDEHGSIVTSLIVGDPCILPCEYKHGLSVKSCDKTEIVVSGIAQHIKVVNAPAFDSGNDADTAINNLMTNIRAQSLSEEENAYIKTSRKQVPIKAIVNFSFAPMAKDLFRKKFLVETRQAYESLRKNETTNKRALLLKWIIEYLDNNMQWIEPSLPDQEWDDMASNRKEIENFLVSEWQKNYYQLEKYKEALKNHILPIADYVFSCNSSWQRWKRTR